MQNFLAVIKYLATNFANNCSYRASTSRKQFQKEVTSFEEDDFISCCLSIHFASVISEGKGSLVQFNYLVGANNNTIQSSLSLTPTQVWQQLTYI